MPPTLGKLGLLGLLVFRDAELLVLLALFAGELKIREVILTAAK